MAVIGFNFDKISVEKKNPIKGSVSVKNDISIVNVVKDSLVMGPKKENILRFDFEFSADYQPDIGRIDIEGNLIFTEKPGEIEKILASWKKDKTIPTDLMTQLVNIAIMRSNIKAFSLAQDVNLPTHIRLPTIRPKDSVASEYIG